MSKEISVINLRISADGKSVIDDNGEEFARFREDIVVRPADKNVTSRLPGHLECTTECIAWDSNGKCVKTYRSCIWVFD
jgi:hypothetical protein